MEITREEVNIYLSEVKACIRAGRYRVSKRDKNNNMFQRYVLSIAEMNDILFSLESDDFSEVVKNEHSNYPDEILYIFGKDVELLLRETDESELVSLYIKFNKLENFFVVVISFHKQEYPILYRFK